MKIYENIMQEVHGFAFVLHIIFVFNGSAVDISEMEMHVFINMWKLHQPKFYMLQ